MPEWDPVAERFRDVMTGEASKSWDQALDDLDGDPDAEPALVMWFGSQVDIKGIIARSRDADRSVRYLTKYLTKSVSETYTEHDHPDAAYEAHIDLLHAEVLVLPCSPGCANWLRFGIEPKDPDQV